MQQADLDRIHARMIQELEERGARIDDVLCLPHAEDSCDCRKPKPGLVLQACRKWDLDLSRSLLLGDSDRDRQLAANCGIRYLAVSEGKLL